MMQNYFFLLMVFLVQHQVQVTRYSELTTFLPFLLFLVITQNYCAWMILIVLSYLQMGQSPAG